VQPPATGHLWLALTGDPLPLGAAVEWAVRPGCGAVVLFAGTVRDHSEGRAGVTELEYEAYEEQVAPRLAAIADEATARWEGLGAVALLHRVGRLDVGEPSVVVVVSAPHRGGAFEAARFCIDTLKATVPIWKRERWEGGEAWGQCAHDVVEVGDLDDRGDVAAR
jgi:molybdopterin synthase catalytic subunit